MLAILDAATAERMAIAQAMEKEGHLETTLQEWLLWWRDVLMVQNNNTSLVLNQDHLSELSQLAERIPQSQVRRFIEAIMTTSGYLRRNVNRQLALEALLLKAPIGG